MVPHEEPRRLPDSEPFPAEPAEPVPEPLREAASGISGAERADALRPADAGGHAADELQPNRTDSTADGGQDSARADADHPDAGPQNEPAGLGTADQQPEKEGGGDNSSDAVRNLTEFPAKAESEQSPSAFALPEFPPTLLPQLLAAETSSRAANAEYLTFYNKNPLLIDRLRFVRESYIVLYIHYVSPISVLVNVLVLGVGAVLGWVSHILYGKYFSKK